MLEPEDFHAMASEVVALAADRCEGRAVALLEGGYQPQRVGQAAVETIRALAGLEG